MFEEAIQSRYRQIEARIERAVERARRTPGDVRLVVVTKAQPLESVKAVITAGAHDLGENYAEQAVEKISAIDPAANVNWHMIGHVQSRKAPLIARHFSFLHSLDSVKLARRLERALVQIDRKLPVLLEYNVGGEATKFGWPAWEPDRWPELQADLDEILSLPHLTIQGIMTVAPYHPDSEVSRPYYQRLRYLRDFLAGKYPEAGWHELSMGMSHDFEIAIEEGATFVRIGEAIMGPRAQNV